MPETLDQPNFTHDAVVPEMASVPLLRSTEIAGITDIARLKELAGVAPDSTLDVNALREQVKRSQLVRMLGGKTVRTAAVTRVSIPESTVVSEPAANDMVIEVAVDGLGIIEVDEETAVGLGTIEEPVEVAGARSGILELTPPISRRAAPPTTPMADFKGTVTVAQDRPGVFDQGDDYVDGLTSDDDAVAKWLSTFVDRSNETADPEAPTPEIQDAAREDADSDQSDPIQQIIPEAAVIAGTEYDPAVHGERTIVNYRARRFGRVAGRLMLRTAAVFTATTGLVVAGGTMLYSAQDYLNRNSDSPAASVSNEEDPSTDSTLNSLVPPQPPIVPATTPVTTTTEAYDIYANSPTFQNAIPGLEAAATTEPEPLGLVEKVINGELGKDYLQGVKVASLDIPSICLKKIEVYGAKTTTIDNVAMQEQLINSGLLTVEQLALVEKVKSGQPLEAHEKAEYMGIFDPLNKVQDAESTQGACEDGSTLDQTKYGARANSRPKGSTSAGIRAFTGQTLANIQPVTAIDHNSGALPGETSIDGRNHMIIAGHRTTESAPFMNLDNMKPGDEILVTRDDGKLYTYVVEEIDAEVSPDSSGWERISGYSSPTSNQTLVLYTCDDGGAVRLAVFASFAT